MPEKKTKITVSDLRLISIPDTLRDAFDNITVDEESGEMLGLEEYNECKEAVEAKIVATGLYIRERNAYIQSMLDTIKSIDKRLKTEQKKVDFLSEMVVESIKALNVDKIESPSIVLSKRQCPPSLEIVNPDLIDKKYEIEVEYVPPKKFDKRKIMADLKNGEKILGVAIKQGKTNLTLK